jgi:hypothetical protein
LPLQTEKRTAETDKLKVPPVSRERCWANSVTASRDKNQSGTPSGLDLPVGANFFIDTTELGLSVLKTSVTDPDPVGIRIFLPQRIRIRIQNKME